MLGLYVHVPFCQAICSYCNFNRGLFDPDLKARYVRALLREIRETGTGEPADTVFFGGGTPSLLEPHEIAAILEACRESFSLAAGAEVTLEANPETVTVERMAGYVAAGVNRVSLGAQSFNQDELVRLGRVHDVDRIGRAVAAAREAGVANLSLDLMFWLPGQSLASWLDSVHRAVALGPEHLSFYLLELYPNAPLKEAMARVLNKDGGASAADVRAWIQASDDEAADMYLGGLEVLDRAGYRQYEISNVARPGFESRHNLKYWTAGSWYGFGCGAHSTVDVQRWHNVASATDYVERVEQGRSVRVGLEIRDDRERTEEALFTGLRLVRGIDRQEFADRFGLDPWAEYGGRLLGARDAGLVWQEGTRFGLSRQGMLLANEILVAFV